jgi:small subunit ribosomal protein S6
MLRNYETVLIFTPVLSDEDVKKAIGDYRKLAQELGCEIIHEEYWGMKQLAYPIKKKTTGIYLVTEFKANPEDIAKLELQYKRDVNLLRFLTIKLDKHAVEYNEKKRLGLVGRKRKNKTEQPANS